MKRIYIMALAAMSVAASVQAKDAAALFKGAKWIEQPAELKAAAPRFTTTFKVDRDGPAEIAICGLGQYVATLNGKPIGRGDEFNLPGWTRSSKTCFYNVFTPTLKAGEENTLEITLGNGMYNVPDPGKGLYTKFTGSEGGMKLIVGGVVKSSVDGWKVSQSEVVRTHVYSGDDIDHRVAADGGRGATALPGETDGRAACPHAAVIAEAPKGELREASFVCRLQEVVTPLKTMRVSDDELTVDFGQNAAYVPTVTAIGPRGSRVEVEFSEIPLGPGETKITKKPGGYHGTVARCAFTLAGNGDETFTPPFFYYGFRYMKVRLVAAESGAHGERALPELVSASARVVMADAPRAGAFECSIRLFNQIHDICWWAQRSNMQSVFTDCPHREKLGWQEQDHIHADQIRWGWNADAMFAKTCRDLADSQLADGMVPDIAPEYTVFRGGFRHSIEWGSSMIQIPWQQYEWTGDDSLIREYWKNMVAYHKYIRSQSQNEKRGRFITPGGLGDWYQQTVSAEKRPIRRTSIDFTATAFYYLNAVTLANCADLIGKKGEAAAFRDEAAKIKKAFNAKWWNPKGHYYENNSQTANSMAIAFGLADPAETAAIVSNIVEDVRGRGAVGTGEIGYPYLLKVLAENGQSDVIFEMTADDTRPGYGYMVRKGNTSCHEAWDCREGSSFNHFMMADIVNWFYGSLGGIRRTSPGFKTFTVAPEFLPGLDWVRASHKVATGEIRVEWRRVEEAIRVAVSVPEGTTATVRLPGVADAEQGPGEMVYTVSVSGGTVCELRSRLSRDVKSIAVRKGGCPGCLVADGESAVPVAFARADGKSYTVAAAGTYGEGRAVAVSHHGFFEGDEGMRDDNIAFLRDCILWLAGDAPELTVYVGRGRGEMLKPLVRALEEAGRPATLDALTSYDILASQSNGTIAVTMPDAHSPADAKKLADFIKRGGGVIAPAVGWGWAQTHPGKAIRDCSFNAALGPAGIYSSGSIAGDPKGGLYEVAASEGVPGTTIKDAIRLFSGDSALSKEVNAECLLSIEQAAEVLPTEGNPWRSRLDVFKASLNETLKNAVPSSLLPIKSSMVRKRLAYIMMQNEWLADPERNWPASPAAAVYPGVPEKGTPRVTRDVEIDLSVPRRHGTGLFAVAGEPLTVTLPEGAEKIGLSVRVGATSCRLTGCAEWKRAPVVDVAFKLAKRTVTFASPFGGTVYIEVPEGKNGKVSVKIGPACPAPWFVEGRDTPETWARQLKENPAPMAELESDRLVITVPTAFVKGLADPRPLLKVWREIMDNDARLTGIPAKRASPERMCVDPQLCCGYMHAGYPIMIPSGSARHLLNEKTIRAGKEDDVWGFFHEMGHNHQNGDWTFNGTGEVTVNFFTLYNMERICGKGIWENTKIGGEGMKRRVKEWNDKGRSFEAWKGDAFLALHFFASLIDKYGWESFEKLFAEYRRLPQSERPKDDLDKRRQWCRRLSKIVGEDLTKEFEFMTK